MKKGITLAAGVVVIGCLFGGYFALKSHNETAKEQTADSGEGAVLDFDTDQITSLAFQIGDIDAVFQYENGTWVMEGDDTFPVDESSINSLLEDLSELTAVRTLEDVEDSLEYGMGEPQNTITFADGEGTETKVTIGATNNTTGDDYVMLDDDDSVIYTVSSSLRTSISDDLYDYAASEELPKILAANINGVSISKGSGGYEIYRDDDTWCVKDADGTILHADKDAVNSAFSNLASSIAYTDFLEHNCEDGSEYGIDDSAAAFTILYEEDAENGSEEEAESEKETQDEIDSDRELTFFIGDTDEYGNYYVQQEGSKEIHTISASVLSPFLDAAAADWEETETETEEGTEIGDETESEG